MFGAKVGGAGAMIGLIIQLYGSGTLQSCVCRQNDGTRLLQCEGILRTQRHQQVHAMTDSAIARTVKGFCQAYGVKSTKAYELLNQGELTAVKAGKRTLILEETAQKWFQSLPKKKK